MKENLFLIDVGGTFTDCIAIDEKGEVKIDKVLSSGRIKGKAFYNKEKSFFDKKKENYPNDFFKDYNLDLIEAEKKIKTLKIKSFKSGQFFFKQEIKLKNKTYNYEVYSGEGSPLLAIRKMLNLKLSEEIRNINLKLGTTKGTNALLERKGADIGFITTKGFKDIVLIGDQTRNNLFKLNIKKRPIIYSEVIEIDERIDSNGKIEKDIDIKTAKEKINQLIKSGIKSIAICLLNSYVNPKNESIIEKICEEKGIKFISTSNKICNTINFLNRCDTTLVSAYLTPVLKDYINNIKKKLTNSKLKLINSAGGLVKIDEFDGKDSILSGPAGGIIGYSNLGKLLGLKKIIGFDMGGTSTDVSKFVNKLDYEYENNKDNIRIITPMLSIETVAAGGGSICKFDGEKLTVGPESSGAEPGPICYGKGGSLSITDLNLYKGKIDEKIFPFHLNKEIVIKELNKILNEVNKKYPSKKTIDDLVDGFIKIANTKMAESIKKITISKGESLKDFTLFSFGGAGSQHACSIAKILNIKEIIISKYSSVLSALGIGFANEKRTDQKTYIIDFSESNHKKINDEINKLKDKILKKIDPSNIDSLKIKKSVDLRYLSENSSINIQDNNLEKCKLKFEKEHYKLYGYNHNNRKIQLVNIRVEIIIPSQKINFIEESNFVEYNPKANHFKNIYFESKIYKTKVFYRKDLEFGAIINGPALIFENHSTIVIEPNWQAKLNKLDAFIITYKNSEETKNKIISTEYDPINIELFNNYFTNIAKQMGIILQKTALSVNVKERMDFSCAILDSEGNLIVNAPHIPVHLGAMSDNVKSIIKTKNIQPGDVFLSNDPRYGGSHIPDLTVITPIFKNKELLFFTASRAHHSEIGGVYPGSAYPFAKNLSEEGVLFNNMKIVESDKLQEEKILEQLTKHKYPSRKPKENIADLKAQIAANNKGKISLFKMVDKYSLKVVKVYMNHIKEYAKRVTEKMIFKLNDGEYKFEDYMDNGSKIKVKININKNQLKIDFSGSSKANQNSMNANESVVKSAILYCLKCLIEEDIPLNSGVFEPIKIIIPEGILNPPKRNKIEECHAVFSGNVELSQRIVDVILGALKISAASQGTMNNIAFGNNQFGYYETLAGGTGAGKGFPGVDATHSHMTNTKITDIEIFEQNYPAQITEFSIRNDSGGKGKYKGGNGLIRKIKFKTDLNLSLLTQRRNYAPYGLKEGKDGKKGENNLIRNGKKIKLKPLEQLEIIKNDILEIKTPGGGGFEKEN